MLAARRGRMLASMSKIDPPADTPLMDWSELSVSGLLPMGTVRRSCLTASRAQHGCGRAQPEGDDGRGGSARPTSCRTSSPPTTAYARSSRARVDILVAAFARRSDAVAGGVGDATRAAGANPAADWPPHRRDPAGRRRQLRRPHNQPHGAATGSGAWRPTLLSGATEAMVT